MRENAVQAECGQQGRDDRERANHPGGPAEGRQRAISNLLHRGDVAERQVRIHTADRLADPRHDGGRLEMGANQKPEIRSGNLSDGHVDDGRIRTSGPGDPLAADDADDLHVGHIHTRGCITGTSQTHCLTYGIRHARGLGQPCLQRLRELTRGYSGKVDHRIAVQCEPIKGKLASLVTFGDP